MIRNFAPLIRLCGAALTFAVASCASTPPIPANMPPRLSVSELRPTPGVMFSDSIEAVGVPTYATEPVGNGDTLMSFQYRYKHTAVLTEDVIGYSITVGGVQAPAGSPGYYAGSFIGGASGLGDLWCFLPRLSGGEREHICLLRSAGSLAAIAPTRMNPYIWRQFAPATGTFDYVHTPIFERRAVEIPGDLTLSYRFERWERGWARLGEYAAGRQVGDVTITMDASGNGRMLTVAGPLWISRIPNDEDHARVSATPPN